MPGGSEWTIEAIEQYDEAIGRIAAALRARLLPAPAGDHQRRADDGRLCVDRHAGLLPPLVLRQAFPGHREPLQARPDGPGLRDRHQLRPVHRLPDGREHAAHAGAGDRPCRLRAQLVLQGQPPVQAVDQRRRHRRLPGVRAQLHRAVRGATWRGRGRAGHRRLPRAADGRRRPLQALVAAVAGQGDPAPAGPRRLPAKPGQRPVAHPAAAAGTRAA